MNYRLYAGLCASALRMVNFDFVFGRSTFPELVAVGKLMYTQKQIFIL
jgi:hypothetical protein